MEKEIKNLKKEIKDLKKIITDLDDKLSKHIVFIEQVYGPLQKSIDKFRRFFK
tara:strand:- start:222 stop:380 length:159 start_codon:yes stop_codon:yes gene_type:complete